ncbi:MAG: homoserine dehydrogenase [Coriobacteriales bacterium]|nr:homoserine dehydrogenase [Coriobacteriales bacterium]
MRKIRLALFGLGTVGGGVVDILKRHSDDFRRHQGVDLELVACTARGPEEVERLGIVDLYRSPEEIYADPDIDIVIELIGGTGFALSVIRDALAAGKHVVTANKAIMARYGKELFDLAESKNLYLGFEASVGAGIPIISSLKHSLTPNEISSVLGIVNGTTNFMLSRMDEDGLDYDVALKEAQERGFAEADPTADVEGHDAAAKIAILASIAFNSRVTIDQVPTEGISKLAPADLEQARQMGYAIKLLAIARRLEGGVDIRVHPTMIPLTHPLAGVNGVYNAIYVTGDAVGDTMLFGEGAGAGSAASGVMADVIEIARFVAAGLEPVVGCTCTDELPLLPIDELETQYYVRLFVHDQPGVLAATSTIFSKHDVSIHSMIQSGCAEGECVNIIFLTHVTRESSIRAALEEIADLDSVEDVATLIRVQQDSAS